MGAKLKSQKGMATLEAVALLVIFTMFTAYALGFFGAIHTGILNSIAARNYGFEVIRHRTSLIFFREDSVSQFSSYHFKNERRRIFRIKSESASESDLNFVAPVRSISMPNRNERQGRFYEDHLKAQELEERNQKVALSPIWVMAQYGICLDSICQSQK